MFKVMSTTTAIAALALAGCAGNQGRMDADAAARDCFSASSVRGFTPINDTTVRIQAGVRGTYELSLFTYCPDIDWTRSIGLRTFGGSSMICTSDATGVEVIVLDRTTSIGPDRCRVQSIRKLDEQELAAEKAERAQAREERKAKRQ